MRDLPHKPGVYLMDRFNRVIYVGKARDLRKRVGSISSLAPPDAPTGRRGRCIESIWDFEDHTVKSEPESLLLEGKLIKEYRPRYNISFRDDKRFLLVKVNLDDPIPALSAHAPEEGRRRALLRAVRAFGLAARDAQPDARQIRICAPAGRCNRARTITGIACAHHQELFRAVRGQDHARRINRAGEGGVRFPRRRARAR